MWNFGSEVFISSILIKRNIRLNSVIRKINDELQELCKKYNLNYLSNDKIGKSFVCDNGVHLSDTSMDILAGNFVSNINSNIFKRIFNSGNLNWQDAVHYEQHANVFTLSVQSNDCQSTEKTLLTSFDIEMVMKSGKTYEKNPIIGYLNLKSLRTKILNLKEILHNAPIDILCIDEAELDDTFPDAQFMIENYQFPPFSKYRNKRGGGKMVFIRKELLAKRLENFETKSTETICIELLSLVPTYEIKLFS